MKRRQFKHWIDEIRSCRYLLDARNDTALSTFVMEFLDNNPKVKLHFTPTYSSWLNQIELWFSKIERDLIYRGVFKSTRDLTRQIMKYIRKYNDDPRPVKWTG